MGFFNELITNVPCSNCNNLYETRIQFKFGATRQLEYRMGDKIIWGFNDVGIPNIGKVKIYGVLGDVECPICHNKNNNDEFDIFLDKDVITGIDQMQDINNFLKNDGHYKILAE